MNHAHSPIIRELPVEIACKIFKSCFSDGMWKKDGQPVAKDALVPLKVGAVCRTWRQIAWSLPELWIVVVVRRIYSTASHNRKQYSLIKQRILRSQGLPLYVFLKEEMDDEEDVDKAELDYWKRSLRVAAKCSDQWKDVTMELSSDSYEYVTSNKLSPPTRKVDLSCSQYMRYNKLTGLRLWQESQSGPSQVTITNPIRFATYSIAWQHVSHVQAKGWPPEDCLTLLKHAPQLTTCSFKNVWRAPLDADENVPGEPVVSHKLSSTLVFPHRWHHLSENREESIRF
ncbi:hypothetical protein CPC08DRAFT_301574 [Agrocybe pediades]|nr:hypothetical protein CPC08DRAFT_301574 [Agrocybe pediades]